MTGVPHSRYDYYTEFLLSPNVLSVGSLHCIADLPHCVNALWLLIEGIGITAGGGAKVNGYNNNE